MSREIKFRAWESRKKELTLINDWSSHWVYFDRDGTMEGIQDTITLMQFTGLHDKNGKEIYESDIVRVTFDCDEDTLHTVVWGVRNLGSGYQVNYPAFCLEPSLNVGVNDFSLIFDSGEYLLEVIGNIHENPELFK